MDWLKRNKFLTGLIGWGVTGAVAWAAQGCAPVYDRDILAVLHVTCGTVVLGLGMASTFLVGAGVMTSDKHEAVKQGFIAPAGRPAVPPPAEVKRLTEERKG
jgi:hypothetical protein